MDDTNLAELVRQAQQHPPGSLDRQRCLTQIYRIMTKSGKISGGSWKSQPYYSDALAETWAYFCSHLDKYDPDKANPITWFNVRLKFQLLEWQRKTQQQQKRICPATTVSDETDKIRDPLDDIPAHPDALATRSILQGLQHWVNHDTHLPTIHIKNRPEITAQDIIHHRLPPNSLEFKDLCTQFAVEPGILKNFWQRHCKAAIAQFLLDHYPYLAEYWDFDIYLKK